MYLYPYNDPEIGKIIAIDIDGLSDLSLILGMKRKLWRSRWISLCNPQVFVSVRWSENWKNCCYKNQMIMGTQVTFWKLIRTFRLVRGFLEISYKQINLKVPPKNGSENKKLFFIFSPQKTGVKIKSFLFSFHAINGGENKVFIFCSPKTRVKIKFFLFSLPKKQEWK